jgi:hypothetical protein
LKKTISYFFLCTAFAALFSACGNRGRQLPDLRETFSKSDKAPFGTHIAYQQLENMFSRNTIRQKKQSFDKTWAQVSDTASLYICISPNLYVNQEETKAMLDYVYSGNSLFIAANYFDTSLLNQIKCSEDYWQPPPFAWSIFFDQMRNTHTGFKDSSNAYSYYYLPFKSSFHFRDTVFTKVLGVNENNKPNYIVYFHGKGKLFLHCDPKAFSNYFLLKHDNYKYMQNALGYTALYPDHLYWDEYYHKIGSRRSSKGSLAELLSHPPLAAAFWLCLLLLALYILFGGKRRQRIIEPIKSNENTTVTFTETIGRLYLQKKDNKNIAEKMCTYFTEYIRNNYFLNSNIINDDFITSLSRKSGVERQKVESLFRAIDHVHNNAAVDDYQLLSLNEQIQNFYKKHK